MSHTVRSCRGIFLTVDMISTLTGIPICGAILQRCNGEYWGLITFAIVSYAASLVCLAAAKISHCGWDQMLAIF
jgi:hypothetical protein